MRRAQELWETTCVVRHVPNGLFAPSQRIVRPRANGLFTAASRPARQPTGEPGQGFFGKGSEKSRLRNRKSKFHKFLPSHPLFFWKWEGYFAAQEQKVEFHDFCQNFFNSVSENLPRNAIYIRFVQSGAGKEPAKRRIAYESPSVSVLRIFHKNPG